MQLFYDEDDFLQTLIQSRQLRFGGIASIGQKNFEKKYLFMQIQ
jgi:hypothetical protein